MNNVTCHDVSLSETKLEKDLSSYLQKGSWKIGQNHWNYEHLLEQMIT